MPKKRLFILHYYQKNHLSKFRKNALSGAAGGTY